MSETLGVISPVTLPSSIDIDSITTSVSSLSLSVSYEFITDTVVIESLTRVSQLFAFCIDLDLPFTIEADRVTALIAASATAEGMYVMYVNCRILFFIFILYFLGIEISQIAISIRAVDEWIVEG